MLRPDDSFNPSLRLNCWGPEHFRAFVERLHWAWYENERDEDLDSTLQVWA